MAEIKSINYSVYVSENNFEEIALFLKKHENKYSSYFILVDENTLKHCLPLLTHKIKFLQKAKIIKIKSGEQNKNIKQCCNIWEQLLTNNADRNSLLINLGGGVICDIGGFAAGTLKRGIDFINIPTTLLAMVDASIGGKTGIDYLNLKNQIGLFIYPKAVFVCTQFLFTLSSRQLKSGKIEMLKHKIIFNNNFLKTNFEKINLLFQTFESIIESIITKNYFILTDPFEKNIRKALNFGHTIGHAIESYSLTLAKPNQLLHGEAIAIGLICELFLSIQILKFDKTISDYLCNYCLNMGKNISLNNNSINSIINLMKHDKKNKNGKIQFVLLSAMGKYKIDIEVDEKLIRQSLNYYLLLSKKL